MKGSLGIQAVTEQGEIRSLEAMEADMIRLALGRYRGHMTEVAKRLGIGRSTLYRKMREFGLEERVELRRCDLLPHFFRFPVSPRDRALDVAFHQVRRRSAEHADAAGVGQQQQPCGMREGIHHQQFRFHASGAESLGSVGDR